VRLFTRNGHDWTDRYPPIVEAALRNRATSFVIDGEAVLLGVERATFSDADAAGAVPGEAEASGESKALGQGGSEVAPEGAREPPEPTEQDLLNDV
jgi:hypothetical protein